MTKARALRTDSIDMRATLRPIGVYSRDPTHRWGTNSFAKAALTPAGPGTMRLTWDRAGATTAEAWGDGADWLLERAPYWAGMHDDVTTFDPSATTATPAIDPRVGAAMAEWWRRHPGLRLAASGLVWQDLLLVLLGQRVTTEEAVKSWVRIVDAWGAPAPGPCDLRLPPPPEVVATRSYVEFHRFNVERHRADAIRTAAKRAGRLEEAATMDAAGALRRLTALPGLGLWTATSVIGPCLGDADTVVLRDYGLPTMVNYAFTGDARRLPADQGGDEVMCGHLAPWSGHRRRIIRLLFAAGVSPPRRGPRAVNPDIRRL